MPTDSSQREPLAAFVLCASARQASLNARLAALVASTIEEQGGSVTLSSIRDFDVPSYNEDVQESDGYPSAAEEIRRGIEASDAFVVCSPEYNASMPGSLKNLIDWLSRFRPQPFDQKQVLLLSASPSMVGGNRGLWSLRVPLEHLGARVYPDMFSLAQAHKAFDGDGRIANEQLHERFVANISAFMDLVEASTHYRCVKKAWVENLGEEPRPGERVDVYR